MLREQLEPVADTPQQARVLSLEEPRGAAVCGEGIEDLDDLRALARVDATYAQGYALARPAMAWPELLPGAAAATSSPVRHGVRIAGDATSGTGTWARDLAEQIGRAHV